MADIPDKLYFKIGEVCQIADVKPHVLRYWEDEFSIIRPKRASSKQRLYRRVDVENILRIRDLLYQKRFTIAGARKALAAKSEKVDELEATVEKAGTDKISAVSSDLFQNIKSELQALKKLLEE